MACKGFWECLLKLFNLVLMAAGLAMVGYGIYLLVEWNRVVSGGGPALPVSNDLEFSKLGRPMLVAMSVSSSFFSHLLEAWSSVKKWLLPVFPELAAAALIFFDHTWKELIPDDKTGNFSIIYDFLDDNWKIAKWVALGAIILEGLLFVLALVVRASNRAAEYDSDDEYIAPRSTIRQPLMNRQGAAATGVPVLGSFDHRPSRNDAWSQRMREKYGLDTSEFTYNPSDPSRYQQATVSQTEEKGCCTIL
ncbi:hypothetical protein ZIOFF_021744 [Zingiber officinale]|uniref:Tobamovirus multiplication protein 2A n=1 Tax=Zingiber officinale TaxID=94328 RepID=A0A8J5H8R1_ZINOF|nr:hypothetical protein ZIOFF_021744 [Zingiber officinale]